MELKLNESDLQAIIQSVLKNIEGQQPAPIKLKTIVPATAKEPAAYPLIPPKNPIRPYALNRLETEPETKKWSGVFDSMQDAITSADMAQKAYGKNFSKPEREKLLQSIRQEALANKEKLARLVFEETKLGVLEHKIAKHELAATKTPGTEDLRLEAFSSRQGSTLVETAPFGVIGAVTPVTNPTETVINNAISMLAGGNAVVFNVHPASARSCRFAVDLLNNAIVKAGGIPNLVTMAKTPTKDTLEELIASPKVKLLVGTGGPALGKKLQSSGKKAIVAGAGNPPVVVDETANLKQAAKDIIFGASFDNNLLCIAEKTVYALDAIADELIFHLLNEGASMLDAKQLEQAMDLVLAANKDHVAQGCSMDRSRAYHPSKEWIGKSAPSILQAIGEKSTGKERLLIFEASQDHPFVQIEQMMPMLPIVRVKNLDEAIDLAVASEHGNRHTAIMHSQNIANLNRFEAAIETTIFVKNASSLAGVGYESEGFGTMTIAGPTGEGLTSARTFVRSRRSVLVNGGD